VTGHRRYNAAVRLAICLAAIVLGLAVGVYGIARLSGGWLGVPPRSATDDPPPTRLRSPPPSAADAETISRIRGGTMTSVGYDGPPFPGIRPVARDWMSFGVVAVGVGLIMTGVLSRRRPKAKSRAPRQAEGRPSRGLG